MDKAIILSRVSTIQQDLRQQTEEVLSEVHKDGFTNPNIIIIEDKESAIKLTEEERHGLNSMKKHILSDPSIKSVYLYELSRLSRRQLVLFSIRDFLVERKIQLICLRPYFRLLEPDGSMSQTGSLMFSIFSSMSESEMTLRKERLLRGKRFKKALGYWMGGGVPFGYRVNSENKLEPHPTNASILKRIYTEYALGDISYLRLAIQLKEEGMFPDNNIFTLQNNIFRWLKSEYYCGDTTYPPIISKALFEKVNEMRKYKQRIRKNTKKEPFLLKGMIRDSQRGLRFNTNSNDGKYHSDKRYKSISIDRKNIDPVIWEYALVLYRNFIMNKSKLRKQFKKELMLICKKIEVADAQISKLNSQIDKVEERMIFGKLSKSRGEEIIVNLTEEIRDTELKKIDFTNQSIAKQQQLLDLEISETITEDSFTLEEKIAIIHKVIKGIVVSKPEPKLLAVSITNNLNGEIKSILVDCYRHTWKEVAE